MNFTNRSLAFLVFAASLSAGSITISDSGTFSAGTATSTYSAPNETWSFSFTVDTNPAVFGVLPGDYFSAPFTGFTYSLNGSSLAITPANIEFFSLGDEGLFNICMISTSCNSGFYFQGPQMYTGSESTPTMLSGRFTSTALAINTGAGYVTQPNTTVQAVDSSVPEPSTFLTLVAGLLALAAGIRYSGFRIVERCRIIPVSVATQRCSGSGPATITDRAIAL
jgi:hypothetical protein